MPLWIDPGQLDVRPLDFGCLPQCRQAVAGHPFEPDDLLFLGGTDPLTMQAKGVFRQDLQGHENEKACEDAHTDRESSSHGSPRTG